MTKDEKQKAIDILRRRYEQQHEQVAAIEPRLDGYYRHLLEHSGTELGDENDQHNVMELLGAVRLLRMLRTYEFSRQRVQQAITDGEGRWECEGKRWRHLSGWIKQPGRMEPEVYRWEPWQVFMIAAIYGPHAWVDTQVDIDSRDLLPTERANAETGHIEDLRRLCTDFVLYGPRKINKSGFAAFVCTEDFMRGDHDAQIFCTANSQDQAKILYGKTQDMLRSFDPQERRIRFTATETNWREGQFRAARMKALPAGGKMPDGWAASTCAKDEYGSAGYTNGRSDMGATVAVVESSMGPRREPLGITTTTASLITSGPFIEILGSLHQTLERELLYDSGEASPLLAEDRQMCLLLEPDEWERDEEYLLTSRAIRRKVNPMLGTIAQHAFYDDEVAKSRRDETKKKETISKLFNVYQSGRVSQWMKGDKIRPLQVTRKITDCLFQEGWQTFIGMDFSQGDDLFAITYLAVNYTPSASMAGRFFADTDCWVLEETMKQSPIRPLYEQWVKDGWLHVCPGEVFDATHAINRLVSLNSRGVNMFMFGYDPAQSLQPINQLKAWLQTLFMQRGDSLKEIAQAIQRMVIPVSQTALSQNPRIGELEHMILEKEPWIQFSENPLWPWMFGNCAAELNSSDLRRIVKGGPQATHKIDGVAALIDAVYLFDLAEGRIEQ